MTFVGAEVGIEIAGKAVTEYEIPNAIICTKPTDCPGFFLGNRAVCACDDQSGIPHSNSRLTNIRLLN